MFGSESLAEWLGLLIACLIIHGVKIKRGAETWGQVMGMIADGFDEFLLKLAFWGTILSLVSFLVGLFLK